MIIETRDLGKVKIDKNQIINFEKGIPGFRDSNKLVLLEFSEDNVIKILQDIENKNTAFFVANPWKFFPDYDIKLSEEELKSIKVMEDEESKLDIFTIITIGEDLESSTCNLLAPIVINIENKLGKQFILNDSSYKTRHSLFKGVKADANTK